MENLEPRIDYVRSYLREIGRIPLLTREQEIEYGTRVQRMMSLRLALGDFDGETAPLTYLVGVGITL